MYLFEQHKHTLSLSHTHTHTHSKTATTILSNARRLDSELRALQLNITTTNTQLNQTQLDADNTESVITKVSAQYIHFY